MSSYCLFCKIVKGEIPCHKIAETNLTLSFLDVNPLSQGHILVIPKAHAARFHELDSQSAADIGEVMRKVGCLVAGENGQTQYNILQNNGPLAHQEVPHVHFHIIPKRDEATGLKMEWAPISHSKEALAAYAQTASEAYNKLQ